MVLNRANGKEPYYQLVCKCGAIEIYDAAFGITATTQRCYRCCGLRFGLRKRERVTAETLAKLDQGLQHED